MLAAQQMLVSKGHGSGYLLGDDGAPKREVPSCMLLACAAQPGNGQRVTLCLPLALDGRAI